MDHESETREEDIQIELEKGILVIEVKGIGGTSSDSDCSQIAKIVSRRQKERQIFDVHGVYIVNHQRFLPPLERKNPPFSQDQIQDAENDSRALITTYDLFRLFFLIEEGIFTREEARANFEKDGLISFNQINKPFLGTVDKTYQNGMVFELNIGNSPISIGDYLIIKKDTNCKKAKIINIQINKIDANTAVNCIAGIKLDINVKIKSDVYKL